MKTKTLVSSLGLAALLLTAGFASAQFKSHGSSSSSSSSGSSGDGAFGQGTNDISVGVGFGSGLGSLYSGGYSSSVGPAIELAYEHGLSDHWGIGIYYSYQSATSTYTYQGFNSNFVLTNYTDTYKEALMVFCARGAYHFTVNEKLDPYVGLNLGYCTISSSYSTTDPSVTVTSSSSLTGIDFGGYGGVRYFFSNHIGAWAELQFATASFKVDLGNGVTASTSINPVCIANLGIVFKF